MDNLLILVSLGFHNDYNSIGNVYLEGSWPVSKFIRVRNVMVISICVNPIVSSISELICITNDMKWLFEMCCNSEIFKALFR